MIKIKLVLMGYLNYKYLSDAIEISCNEPIKIYQMNDPAASRRVIHLINYKGGINMQYFDFRSDTSTLPTKEMIIAVTNAKLGNDGYGEDPTVNELEKKSAILLGKEAAVLVPSGTMGNLIALMTHCGRGQEVILEATSHILKNEMGGISSVAHLIPRTIEGTLGVILPEQVEKLIRPKFENTPKTGLVCIENTHNQAGGTIFPLDIAKSLCEVAHEHNIPVHLDGERIFNAAVALGVDVKRITKPFDSVMFGLSKSLCCPIGSVFLGSKVFIEKARKIRHMLGGRMRQAGIIAAFGIVALDSMIDRLSIDHANAKRLAQGLSKLSYIHIDLKTVQTNIVRFNIIEERIDRMELFQSLKNCAILVDYKGDSLRMVTQNDISQEAVNKALTCFKKMENNAK